MHNRKSRIICKPKITFRTRLYEEFFEEETNKWGKKEGNISAEKKGRDGQNCIKTTYKTREEKGKKAQNASDRERKGGQVGKSVAWSQSHSRNSWKRFGNRAKVVLAPNTGFVLRYEAKVRLSCTTQAFVTLSTSREKKE